VIDRFTEVIGLQRFVVYVFDVFDDGAPTGFRLAARHPERITAIISQNGNAYDEGLSDGWATIRAYWEDRSTANRATLRSFLAPETTVARSRRGPAGPARELPHQRRALPKLPGVLPHAQSAAPGGLGRNDPFFLPPGAEAFTRNNPNAEVQFFDTGHFALETHVEDIAAAAG